MIGKKKKRPILQFDANSRLTLNVLVVHAHVETLCDDRWIQFCLNLKVIYCEIYCVAYIRLYFMYAYDWKARSGNGRHAFAWLPCIQHPIRSWLVLYKHCDTSYWFLYNNHAIDYNQPVFFVKVLCHQLATTFLSVSWPYKMHPIDSCTTMQSASLFCKSTMPSTTIIFRMFPLRTNVGAFLN